MAGRSDRVVYVVFSDQSRTEEKNKGLFIGSYGATMIVEGVFPAFLASLAITLCIKPKKEREKLRLQVHIPGFPEPTENAIVYDAKNPLDTLLWRVVLTPCVFRAPGDMKVVVEFEDGDISEHTLLVVSNAEYKESSW